MMDHVDSKQELNQWFVENLPYNILWMDQKANIIFANKSICKTLKYNKSEMESMSMMDVNPNLTVEKWDKHWNIVKKKKVDFFKTKHVRKDGKEERVEVYSLFFSNNGKELICSIIRDISETIYYRTILEHTENAVSVGGWKWNLVDKTVIASKVALEIFGFNEPEELLPANIIHKFVDPDRFRSLFSNAVRKGESFDTEIKVKGNNGGIKWVRCVLDPYRPKGKTEKLFGTYQDITEQKKRQHLLELSYKVIDNANDIIFIWERTGELFRFNQAATKQLGFSKKKLSEATIYDMDSGITPGWWQSHFDELIEKGSLTFEWVATRKDNTRFPVDINANIIEYEGRYLNCAILRDISERKEREKELRNAFEEIKQLKDQLEIENEYLQEEINISYNFDTIICQSEEYKKVLLEIEKVARTDSTILITGESGTGKELLARSAHQNSLRQDKPLIKVNCAALPKELIESELFGHKKGAFTGAIADKIGKFELADKGTIFLDEIGELPLDLQPKLLRVLQEGEFDRLGDNKTTKVDIRVIAATNRNLEEMIKEGKFREDLYYRLNVFPVHNIPLRDRKSDIPLLAKFFMDKYSVKSGKNFKRLSKSTIKALMDYQFPGNIRELENIIERAVIIESGTTIFPGPWLPVNTSSKPIAGQFLSFEEHQRKYIIDVLFHTNWRVSGDKGAARILGMKDKTLFAKMKKLGIRKEDFLKRD